MQDYYFYLSSSRGICSCIPNINQSGTISFRRRHNLARDILTSKRQIVNYRKKKHNDSLLGVLPSAIIKGVVN